MSFCDDDAVSNPTATPAFSAILEKEISRRAVLKGGAGTAAVAFLAGAGTTAVSREARANGGAGPLLGFTSVPVSTADAVVVPDGYVAEVLYAWGDPISDGPAFAEDASQSAADQERQAGMHHDGMHFFAVDWWKGPRARRGLLCMNHEYVDDGLLHPDGTASWSAEKVRKAQAAHGISVIELRKGGDGWSIVRPSSFARRITAYTPMRFSGPAAGAPALQTEADPTGRSVLGTINDCAHGHTPWGTYLACEENFNGYFVRTSGTATPDESRYGLGAGFGYRWHEFDERFDLAKHPNEANRFGWVVEIDPFSPRSTPVKRTALGRFKHEGAWVTTAHDLRAVVYMGDDERFEYIYKFVSRHPWPLARLFGRSPLDEGTLYVAKFNDDADPATGIGSGEWRELTFGKNGLTPENGFASQADVVVRCRQAADAVLATKMDRPEWIAVHPRTKEVYCTLTNNSQRGPSGRADVDAANPRRANVFGHIVRWRERNGDPRATTFAWDLFVLAGDPLHPDANKRGNIQGDVFGSPDGLWFDDDGRLWIQTDVSTSTLNAGDYANVGNNQMLCADPETKEIRRFLTGPKGCEVTGVVNAPDNRTMFVNIQHPGEPASERNDPANPKAVSSWPDGPAGGRPRAGTIAIRKLDGGVIGS